MEVNKGQFHESFGLKETGEYLHDQSANAWTPERFELLARLAAIGNALSIHNAQAVQYKIDLSFRLSFICIAGCTYSLPRLNA